ncbi:hypothetical protein [Streptomyces chrestomyceticus]|uniref:hypothetical protein n=1 Tax=Streptomyces chrestomyceticus TaxID=68185 RepID=UPI0033CE8889
MTNRAQSVTAARRLRHQVRSEVLKTRWSLPFLVLLAIVAFTTASSVYGTATTHLPKIDSGVLTLAEATHDLVRLSFGSLLFTTVFGVLCFTAELRHRTLARTLLQQPGRPTVLAAKAIVCAVTGAIYGAAALLVATLVTWATLTANGRDFRLDREDLLIAVGILLVNVLAGLWGLGIGVLVRSQVSAVSLVLAWTLLIETMIIGFLPETGRWLPGGAQEALYRGTDRGTLDMLPGGLLFCGYTCAVLLAAWAWLRRTEID